MLSLTKWSLCICSLVVLDLLLLLLLLLLCSKRSRKRYHVVSYHFSGGPIRTTSARLLAFIGKVRSRQVLTNEYTTKPLSTRKRIKVLSNTRRQWSYSQHFFIGSFFFLH